MKVWSWGDSNSAINAGYFAGCSHIRYHSSAENPRDCFRIPLYLIAPPRVVSGLYLFSYASRKSAIVANGSGPSHRRRAARIRAASSVGEKGLTTLSSAPRSKAWVTIPSLP